MENKAASTFNRLYQVVLRGALLIALIGCGTTTPSKFYTLSPLTRSEQETRGSGDMIRLSVEVGPVEIPKYLERPQIVTRLSPNKIQPAAFDRWAEPLQDNVLGVLVENLTHLLWADQIVVSSWTGSKSVNYRVPVEVIRFDGQQTR